ncbi:uncharacterized protein RCH25_025916 [Pelodytes ibericus]
MLILAHTVPASISVSAGFIKNGGSAAANLQHELRLLPSAQSLSSLYEERELNVWYLQHTLMDTAMIHLSGCKSPTRASSPSLGSEFVFPVRGARDSSWTHSHHRLQQDQALSNMFWRYLEQAKSFIYSKFSTDTRQIDLPALGRPFSLGMLYDCREDKLIPGITLWNNEALANNITSSSMDNTSFELVTSDTISDKSLALNVTASLKASFLSGLVEVDGSGTYLKDTKSSKSQARVTLKFSRSTRFDKLGMNHLGIQNVAYPKVFDEGSATHVVTGILYGAQAFFIFDQDVSTSDSTQDIQGDLRVMIQKITSISVDGRGDLTMTDQEKEYMTSFSCKFHGDFALDTNPVNYEEAIKVYASLPKLLGQKGEKAVPVRVWLYPLNKLDNRAARLVRDISDNLIYRAEKIIQQMADVNMQCNDLMRHAAAQYFPAIYTKINQFKESCERFTLLFQKQLARTLPAIRGGGKEEEALIDILTKVETSPFARCKTEEYLNRLKEEMELVGYCLTFLKPALPSDKPLSQRVMDLTVKYFVCYNFTSLSEEQTFVSDMSHWLQSQGNSDHDIYQRDNVTQWFNDEQILHRSREYANAFHDYTLNNQDRAGTRYIISSTPNTQHPGASIYLYEKGLIVSSRFEPPAKPSAPGIIRKNHASVRLSLNPADFGKQFVEGYKIEYRIPEEETWENHTTENNHQEVLITGLKPNTTYHFRYSATCKAGVSVVSDHTTDKTLPTSPPEILQWTAEPTRLKEITPKEKVYHLKDQLHKSSKLLRGTKPTINQLETDFCDSGYRQYSIGKENLEIPKKVILLIGATGTGKTTLINGMANYILGVEWKDDFRFKLINEVTVQSQAHSQTSLVTAYHIYHDPQYKIPYSITLIDTPGFGDTRGIDQDKKITEAIDAFFKNGIDQIDAVCFVVQASSARLTHTQKYIFNSVFSIFGKDIKDNILILINFSDGQRPPVLDAIKEADIPYSVDSKGESAHFKFNNSALFADNQANQISFNEMFWKMGALSMEEFFTSLNTLETKSLKLTKEVLKERKKLEVTLQALQPQIKAGLVKIEGIRKTETNLQQNRDLMEANKNFEFEVDIMVPVQEEIKGHYITNCQQCSFTCHDNCAIPDDKDKGRCSAMSNGYCTVCPNKCIWNVHFNQKYKWIYENRKEKKTYDQIKANYEQASGEVMTVQKVFKTLTKEYNKVKEGVLRLIGKSYRILQHLREIALKPNPLTTTEYIDLMIQSEEQEVKPGYLERIQSLREMRSNAELIARIENGEDLLQELQSSNPGITKREGDDVRSKIPAKRKK